MVMTYPAGVDLRSFVRRDAQSEQMDFLVRGARCAACVSKIEAAVRSMPGVETARLNLTSGKLAVATRFAAGDPGAVIAALDQLGYPATPYDPQASLAEQDREGRRLLVALGVAAFGAANVMMFSVPVWAGVFGQELEPATRTVMYWLSALVAAPCTVFAGQTFFASAWRSLRRGRANMDVPISIGVLLTLLVSFAETAMGGAHAYFDAAVMLLFLLLIGRYLDHRLRLRAASAARDLMALQTPFAMRLDAAGAEHGVPVRDVQVGDRIAVAPGDRIPVDGRIESGASDLDNALITGETWSVTVGRGLLVHAGALNLTGRLVLVATARSEDSTLAAIGRLLEAGAQSRSRFVRWADKAAAVYIPTVHGLALLTFLGAMILDLGPREALLRGATLLIVTCPCALGLAVPAVLVTATGRLFRGGVLVKSGAALERLAEVRHVIFDKTGVLTEGRPQLIFSSRTMLQAAAPLARASRHPLARVIAEAAGPGPVASDVIETAGLGVEGVIDGRRARLGRATFLGLAAHDSRESELWFGFDGDTKLRFAFEDRLRDDAKAVIDGLRRRGLTVEIMSGDVRPVVARIAEALGVRQWRAGVTPVDKAAAVDVLQAQGIKVLMVGDGLNDAGALAKAHCSMAPGLAAEVSQSAADLVFTRGDLTAVTASIDIARRARSRVNENFGFSALYNLVAAPVAVLGLVNPLIAAVAMSASSLIVTLNALRMTWGRVGR